jgi:SAM-dependent methyltransferase
MKRALRALSRRLFGPGMEWRVRQKLVWPPVRLVRFGSLRRLTPISEHYGFERGTPIDRHYIADFMTRRAGDIRGHVMEVGEDTYTKRFGGDAVERVDVLHVTPGHPGATIVADLSDAPHIPDGTFDCVVCLQTLLLVWDVRAAVETIHRVLAPGGVALVTVPGITKVNRAEADQWGDWWRFTAQSATRLFEESFGEGAVAVDAYGNVLAAAAQLYGIAAEELRTEELAHRDRDYEVVLGVRAVKT